MTAKIISLSQAAIITALTVFTSIAATKPAFACYVPDPPGSQPVGIWLKATNIGIESTTGFIAYPINPPMPLPPPGVSSQCATGISFPEGFPTSLEITDARVGRGNSSDIVNTFVELGENGQPVFDFEVDNTIKGGIANGNLNPDGVTSPISNNLSNWFTFSDLNVWEWKFADFPLTPELPNYFVVFDLMVNTSEFQNLVGLGTQYAAGSLNNPTHPIQYSGLGIIPIETIPEPTSTLSLLALGTLGAVSTLKRKLKPSQSTEKETTKVG
jgi:hypothetical protein